MLKFKKIAMLGILAGLLSVSTACFAANSISADKVDYDFRTGQATATGNVKIRHDKGTASAQDADYNTKSGEGKLTGSVVADQDDAHLTSSELILKKEGHYLSAVGNAVLVKADKTLRAAQVNYDSDSQYAETIGDWAQMTMTDGSSIDSSNMNYSDKTGVAHANGNVRLISPPRNLTARADNAVYNTRADDGTIQLFGHATATQNDDTVSGDTLTIKGAGGKIAMGEGNVKMVVIPQSQQKTAGGPVAAPAAAIAGRSVIPKWIYKFYNWPGEPMTLGNIDLA